MYFKKQHDQCCSCSSVDLFEKDHRSRPVPLLCVATCKKCCVLHTLAVDPSFGPLVSITSCCRATNGRITRCGRFKDVALGVHRVGTASLCREFVDSTADRCWQCKGVTNTYTSAETHICKTSLLTHMTHKKNDGDENRRQYAYCPTFSTAASSVAMRESANQQHQ